MGQCCGTSKHPKQEIENNEGNLSESGSYSDEYQIIQEDHAKISVIDLEALGKSNTTNESKKPKNLEENSSEMPKAHNGSAAYADGVIKVTAKANATSIKQPKVSSDSEKQEKNVIKHPDPKPKHPDPILKQPIELGEQDNKKKVIFHMSKSSSSSSSSIPINISGNIGFQSTPLYPENHLDANIPIIISDIPINLNDHFHHHSANAHVQIAHPHPIINEPIMHKAPNFEVNDNPTFSIYSGSDNALIVSNNPPNMFSEAPIVSFEQN